jgi:predicted nucleic acid-binding protein
MRVVDADILSYALFRRHDAHPYCWPLLQNAIHGKVSVAIATVSLLEAYHALVEDYRVEREEAFRKLDVLTRSRRIRFLPMTIDIARRALEVAKAHKVRSFDANLIASAETNEISVIVSNDKHVARLCEERGLILENPIPEEVANKMRL